MELTGNSKCFEVTRDVQGLWWYNLLIKALLRSHIRTFTASSRASGLGELAMNRQAFVLLARTQLILASGMVVALELAILVRVFC